MEKWDIYDKNRQRQSGFKIRGESFLEGERHLVVHVCIFNDKDEMLIQKRTDCKEIWPGYWDVSVGGSALAGEDTLGAAKRETLEELGIEIYPQRDYPQFTVNFDEGFDDIFLIEAGDLKLEDLSLQADEVSDAMWASEDKVMSLIDSGDFIPWHKPIIRMCFGLRNAEPGMKTSKSL